MWFEVIFFILRNCESVLFVFLVEIRFDVWLRLVRKKEFSNVIFGVELVLK